MRKQAYIVDVYAKGCYHEVINQGYLMMIAELYEHVTYIADKTSCDNLCRLLDECGFNYSNVDFKEKNFSRLRDIGHPSIDYLSHLFKISLQKYYYYMKIPKNCDVFYNNNLFFGIFLINFLSFGKEKRCFVMCHNDMEQIQKRKNVGLLGFVVGHFFRWIFRCVALSQRLTFILLSEDMCTYFREFVSHHNQNRIQWIDHCYIRPYVEKTNYTVSRGKKINLGIPGYLSSERGIPQLKILLSKIKNDKLVINSISVVAEEIKDSHFEVLNPSKKPLDFKEYNTLIQEMDAMLFLYPVGSYRLTASGAVLEAIWNEKPIFALENFYFRYLFRRFGAMGKLFPDESSMAGYLNGITIEEFNSFQENLRKAKKSLMPSSVKLQFQKVIDSK